jgi:hypothetical protein
VHYYTTSEDWAYRYEVSAPSYIEAARYAEVNGLQLREWNWKPDEEFRIRDKRAF